MSLGRVGVRGDAADDHHGGPGGPHYLDLGEGLPLLAGVLALQCPGTPALTLVAEPQTVGLGLLDNPDEGLAGVVVASVLAHGQQVVVGLVGLQAVTGRHLLVVLVLHHLRHRGHLVHQASAGLRQVLLLGQVDELVDDAGQGDVTQRVRVHGEA